MPSDQPIAELKPCPFCGSEALWTAEEGVWYMHHSIFCSRHRCPASRNRGVHFQSKESAIAAWNTRAIEAQIAALTQQLTDEIAKGLANERQIRTDAQGKIEALRTRCDALSRVIAAMLNDEDFAELCHTIGEEPQWLKDGRAALAPVAQPSAEGTEAADGKTSEA